MADLDHLYPGIPALLRAIDYPVTSETFPSDFTGERNLLRAMQQIHAEYGSRAICATLGIGGAVLWEGTRFWYARSYRVRALDTTGAGDVFHAGFAYGVLKRWDWRRVLEFGCAAAGLNCTALGARGGIRPLRQIESLRRTSRKNLAAFTKEELAQAARRWTQRRGPADALAGKRAGRFRIQTEIPCSFR